MRNVPPPESRIGAERSIASCTRGSLEKVAVSAPIRPSSGVVAQTIIQGSTPRTTKTATKRP